MKIIMKKIKTLLLLGMFATASTVWAEGVVPDSIAGTTKVTAKEAIYHAETSPNLVMIDSRKKEDRQAAGWIPGSIPLPNTETTPETLAKHIPSKSTPVLFYCNGPKCGRSAEAAKVAIKEGYSKIYWFHGGWEEWSKAGLPAEK